MFIPQLSCLQPLGYKQHVFLSLLLVCLWRFLGQRVRARVLWVPVTGRQQCHLALLKPAPGVLSEQVSFSHQKQDECLSVPQTIYTFHGAKFLVCFTVAVVL